MGLTTSEYKLVTYYAGLPLEVTGIWSAFHLFVILQRLYVGLYNEKIMDLALKYIFQGCKTVNSDF